MPPLLEDMTDPDRPVTRRELREELEALFARLATKDDLKAFATKDDLKAFATKVDLHAMRDELRTHFDVVAEDFKKQFGMLYDWAQANVDSLAKRVESIEDGHGARLLGLETRVTRLEHQK
jgi:hypothetical protein